MDKFDYEKLDVYNVTADFVALAYRLSKNMGRGNADLADQLRRASQSILLNLAEGAGEYAAAEKARFYRLSRRSATECAAILDICARAQLLESSATGEGRTMLLRIVSMLVKLIQAQSARD
jgi:four helix bundle protein